MISDLFSTTNFKTSKYKKKYTFLGGFNLISSYMRVVKKIQLKSDSRRG